MLTWLITYLLLKSLRSYLVRPEAGGRRSQGSRALQNGEVVAGGLKFTQETAPKSKMI